MGCNQCVTSLIQNDVQAYFIDAMNCLKVKNINLSEFIKIVKTNLIDYKHKPHSVNKEKCLEFFNSIKDKDNLSSVTILFPDKNKFIDFYLERLNEKINYGLEELIIFMLCFLNKEDFNKPSIVKELQDLLIELIFINKDYVTFNFFRSLLSEVVYNIITLPAICIYLLSTNENVKKEINYLIDGNYKREKINTFSFKELKFLDTYTFFSKENLERIISYKILSDRDDFQRSFIFSWDIEQLFIGFNLLT